MKTIKEMFNKTGIHPEVCDEEQKNKYRKKKKYTYRKCLEQELLEKYRICTDMCQFFFE